LNFAGALTLRRWASNVYLRGSLIVNALNVMKIVGEKWTPRQKLCVLAFDKMKVKETLEYDEKADEIVGPHNYMQLVMGRALCAKWKQHLWVDFDKKMTKEILFHIIEELHKIDYQVVSCVSDCGGGNVGLWKQNELNVTMDEPYFLHPVTKKKVFLHLMYLIY
jgi:hypothetical protein